MNRLSFVFLLACGAAPTVEKADELPIGENADALSGPCRFGDLRERIQWCEGTELTLMGFVPMPAMTAFLAQQNLVPVVPPGLPPGLTLLLVAQGRFSQSNYGPYSDSFGATLVARAGDPAGTANWYFFAQTNSNLLALTVSESVWHFDLHHAITKVRVSDDNDAGTATTFRNGAEVLRFSMARAAATTQGAQNVNAFAYSPVTVQQTKYPVLIQSTTFERPYDASVDAFSYDASTELGATLDALGFMPAVWQIARSTGTLGAPVSE